MPMNSIPILTESTRYTTIGILVSLSRPRGFNVNGWILSDLNLRITRYILVQDHKLHRSGCFHGHCQCHHIHCKTRPFREYSLVVRPLLKWCQEALALTYTCSCGTTQTLLETSNVTIPSIYYHRYDGRRTPCSIHRNLLSWQVATRF